MAVPPGYSCRSSISGRAASGFAGFASWKRTSRASGNEQDITSMATLGKNSAMPATETSTVSGRKLDWQRARVREILIETTRVRSLLLHVPNWRGHVPGQHVDI